MRQVKVIMENRVVYGYLKGEDNDTLYVSTPDTIAIPKSEVDEILENPHISRKMKPDGKSITEEEKTENLRLLRAKATDYVIRQQSDLFSKYTQRQMIQTYMDAAQHILDRANEWIKNNSRNTLTFTQLL